MPLYEYRCQKCGGTFEVIQKFSDEPVATHEGCGGTVEKLLSAPSFQFKGTGWYVTDYGKNGKVPSGSSSGNSESKSDNKSDTKKNSSTSTESKPAADSKPAAPAKTE